MLNKDITIKAIFESHTNIENPKTGDNYSL